MPLSKKMDRERKRRIRLEMLLVRPVFQPKTITLSGDTFEIRDIELDADGQPIPEY